MNRKKDVPYCLMPWVHLHIGDQGVAKACCVANIPFGNINSERLDEIWKGASIEKLRAKFSSGNSDPRCSKCINVEKAGGKSMRLETFDKYGHLELGKNELPYYFDIRFSNVCNFRCRTCWHGASSKWFTDAKALGRNIANKAIIKNIKDFNVFIDKVGPALKHAKEIYLAGGEPLVTEEHYLLLDWLVKEGNTDVFLRYNSNFSHLQFKEWDCLELWKQFPNVEIMASIDGTGRHGEYIRKEMNWKGILKNREKVRNQPNIKFKVSPTVSVLNMELLPLMYQHLCEIDFIQPQELYLNLLERPSYYSIQIFSAAKKMAIEKTYSEFFHWLTQNEIDESIQDQFQVCLDYMKAKDQSNLWAKYLQETSQLNELRNETAP